MAFDWAEYILVRMIPEVNERDPGNRQPVTPGAPKLSTELRGLVQLPRIAFGLPGLLRTPKGSGVTMLVPGYGTNDTAMLMLRGYLASRGHTTSGWGLGVNKADIEDRLPAFTANVEKLADAENQPVVLIGWSMGGVFAREVARDRPDLVNHVITLGTPVIGGPKFTASARFYSPEQVDDIERTVAERNLMPIEAPITACFSKIDGIVDWNACVDTFSPNVEMVEVDSTHIGMLADPTIWKIAADVLAQH